MQCGLHVRLLNLTHLLDQPVLCVRTCHEWQPEGEIGMMALATLESSAAKVLVQMAQIACMVPGAIVIY